MWVVMGMGMDVGQGKSWAVGVRCVGEGMDNK